MQKTRLRKYAHLIAAMGVNIQKGQEVIVTTTDLNQPEFVRMVVEECYRAGAKKVSVEWGCQSIEKLHYKYRTVSTLSRMEEWEVAKLRHRVDVLPAMIYLDSDDPDGFKGVNQTKMAKARQARYKIIKPYREQMENRYQWCIAAIPGPEWAKKIFPKESKSAAIEKLWEAILFTARVDEDPVRAWEEHNRDLADRCAYLNSLGLESLEYRAGNGTDFKVGILEDTLFMGGAEKLSGKDLSFNPNIPSEEAFISPRKGAAEGIVYASRPLSYNGEIIDGFWVRFEGGKVVDVHADRNEDLLREMIGMDEGASMLGEVALVPYNSPIRESGLLFYSTLFDENAACHLALGAGFTNCLKNYEKYTQEECYAKGINNSMIHVDFMIGTADLEITGITKDQKRVPIFREGNWAF